MTRILVLIIAVMLGNFVWFVNRWDPALEEPLTLAPQMVSTA